MTTVYMMVGIPASGKTTLAKELIGTATDRMAYVSRDEIRRKVTGSGKVVMSKEKEVLEQFCLEILVKVSEEYDLIFADATHSTPRSRYFFYRTMHQIAEMMGIPATDFSIIPLVVETPYEICYERNSRRDASFAAPDEDMKNFYSKYIYPSKTELGLDKLFPYRLFFDTQTQKFKAFHFN